MPSLSQTTQLIFYFQYECPSHTMALLYYTLRLWWSLTIISSFIKDPQGSGYPYYFCEHLQNPLGNQHSLQQDLMPLVSPVPFIEISKQPRVPHTGWPPPALAHVPGRFQGLNPLLGELSFSPLPPRPTPYPLCLFHLFWKEFVLCCSLRNTGRLWKIEPLVKWNSRRNEHISSCLSISWRGARGDACLLWTNVHLAIYFSRDKNAFSLLLNYWRKFSVSGTDTEDPLWYCHRHRDFHSSRWTSMLASPGAG